MQDMLATTMFGKVSMPASDTAPRELRCIGGPDRTGWVFAPNILAPRRRRVR
jgi:hypothetical protein